jgi:glycerol-3-phosphate dehydrogenase (NAD(P)+)
VNVTILGAGAWGTALGLVLHRGGHRLTFWGNDPAHLEELQRSGRNERYLPGVELPRDWRWEPVLARAVASAETVIVAVPSKAFRTVAAQLAGHPGLVVSVTKGIDYDSGLTMGGVLQQTVPEARIVVLSGPTLALEVARGIPTAIVAAGAHADSVRVVQQMFHHKNFRVYSSPDPLGVELGGALKNVVAIAAGVGDGLGFGDNSKAALITRGIAEIRRLGVACGARAETFAGLSGLGDLTVTCFSRLSRNRGLGERLGRGEKLKEILAQTTAVAEGYPTARSARHLARKLQLVTPIIDEVYAVLYEDKDVAQALCDLTSRESRAES